MYCNGYIIICIFFGAYIGSFFFHWESIIIGYVVQNVVFICGY